MAYVYPISCSQLWRARFLPPSMAAIYHVNAFSCTPITFHTTHYLSLDFGSSRCFSRIHPYHVIKGENPYHVIKGENPLSIDLPYVEEASEEDNDISLDEEDKAQKLPRRMIRHQIEELLSKGMDPVEILASRTDWYPVEFWAVMDYLKFHRRYLEALQVFEWFKTQPGFRPNDQHYTYLIQMLGKVQRIDLGQHYFDEMKTIGTKASVATVSTLLQSYAEFGLFEKAEQMLTDMIQSDTKPNAVTYTGLIHAYGKHGLYDNMSRTFNNMKTVGCHPDGYTYCSLIRAYAEGGLFRRMEKTWREMDLLGWQPDNATINVIIHAYAEAGLVKEMAECYSLVREYSFLLKADAVRAIALSFIRRSRFYQLKGFLKDVGLKRHDLGNLLWNLLLLSHSANFQMRNLVTDFEAMEEAGFTPDLTTCNILALSFSRMQMFWDLHVLAVQMQSRGIVPDLVTFGAIVDAYMKERLPFKKLYDALDELQVKDAFPEMQTDTLVLEAFGVGDFQQSCEVLLESRKFKWTYGKLTAAYLKRFAKPPRFQPTEVQASLIAGPDKWEAELSKNR